MITKISLQNFESHKDTVLKPSPGLTVFIGESDRGKSGTFRAFNWVCTNRPLGDGMRPLYWEGDTIVGITTDDKEEAARLKSKSLNNYMIIGKEENWNGNAGTDVPQKVKDILRIEETNFQSQIDRAFLMFDSPGERGRVLNKIAGLDKIDFAIKNASSDIQKMKQTQKHLKISIKEGKEKLKQYEGLEELQDKLAVVESLSHIIHQQESERNAIYTLLAEHVSQTKELDRLGDFQKIFKKHKKAIEIYRNLKTRGNTLEAIKTLKNEREMLLSSKKNSRQLNRRTSRIKRAAISNDLLSDLMEDRDRIVELQQQWEKLEKEINNNEKEIQLLSKKLPKICPTCGEVLK